MYERAPETDVYGTRSQQRCCQHSLVCCNRYQYYTDVYKTEDSWHSGTYRRYSCVCHYLRAGTVCIDNYSLDECCYRSGAVCCGESQDVQSFTAQHEVQDMAEGFDLFDLTLHGKKSETRTLYH